MITLGRNISLLSTQRSLDAADAKVSSSVERLSSGQRINGPSDDAASLAIAASLQVDRRVTSRALINANDGISLLNTAEQALESVKEILLRQEELAVQASNGSYSNVQRRALDAESRKLTEEFNRIVGSTTFNGQSLFSPSSNGISIQMGHGEAASLNLDLGSEFGRSVNDGTFTLAQAFTTGANAVTAPEIADINGDGYSDIATISGTQVFVSLGNGDGTFKAAVTKTIGAGTSITSGDFDGDGNAEFAVGMSGASSALLVNFNPDGTIADTSAGTAESTRFFTLQVPGGGVATDSSYFTFSSPSTSYYVWLNNTDPGYPALNDPNAGAFGLRVDITSGEDFRQIGQKIVDAINSTWGGVFSASRAETSYIYVTNRQEGAAADAAVANCLPGVTASTLTNGVTGSNYVSLYGTTPYVEAGDLNGDGLTDLFSVNLVSSSLSVRLNLGLGQLAEVETFSINANTSKVAAGDFNGDGKLDLTVYDSGLNIGVLLGNGDGTFKRETTASRVVGGMAPEYSLRTGDINLDGFDDISYQALGRNNVLLGNGDGTFLAPTSFLVPVRAGALTDLDEDGALDYLAANAGVLGVTYGNGDGSFKWYSQDVSLHSSLVYYMTPGDYNGDGVVDLLTRDAWGGMNMLLGNGRQTFNEKVFSLGSAAQAKESLVTIQEALADVSLQLGIVGAARSRLETGATLLRSTDELLASGVSRIMDSDVASETASLTRNQILRQTAAAVLAHSNGNQALVLKLLT